MKLEPKHAPLLDRKTFYQRIFRSILIASGMISASLLIGILGYHYLCHLRWLDSLLNSSMILTGMGPVDKMDTDAAKWFASFYAMFSGIAFLTTMGVVLTPILHRFMHKFHLGDDE